MYTQIKKYLNISEAQIDKPTLNFAKGEDSWRELRVFMNIVLQNHPNFFIDPKTCQHLISDIEIATTEEGKDKLYKTSGDSVYGMHLLDCFIYMLTTYFNDYVKRM